MTERTSFLAELKRRNVIRVAIAYVAVSWLVMQAGTLLFQTLELSNAVSKGLLALLVIGFIPTLVFSWIYELTPEGLKRESEIARDESITRLTGRKLDYLVIGVMAAVIALLIFDRFVLLPRQAARAAANPAASAPANPAAAMSAPAPAPAPPQATIAVLPFVNMSEEKANEYFADGISEELLNLLAKIPQLQVTARTSSFSFKGKDIPIPEIARTLQVAHILEGSVRKAGDQVRVTAQLINAVSDKHLWSQTYDRKLDDVFAIQDEIAADVVKALRVTLLGELPKATTTSPEAYALYLQGNEGARAGTPEALAVSDAFYRRALDIDSKYVPAWDGLTRNAINRANTASTQIAQAWLDARRVADHALTLDPDFARTHGRLGSIALRCCDDLAGAVRHFQRALALDPGDPVVLANAAGVLGALGRVDQAIATQEAVLRRDPVNVAGQQNLAGFQRYAGRYDDSIASYRTVLSLAPDRRAARTGLAASLLSKGDAREALAEIEQEKAEQWQMIMLPLAYHALGRKSDSDAALAALIAKWEKEAAYNIAYVYAFRGEADKTFEWLDKAVKYKDAGISSIVTENLFEGVHADPRWLEFLRRIGKAPEQLAQIQFEVKIPPSIDDTGTSAPQPAKP